MTIAQGVMGFDGDGRRLARAFLAGLCVELLLVAGLGWYMAHPSALASQGNTPIKIRLATAPKPKPKPKPLPPKPKPKPVPKPKPKPKPKPVPKPKPKPVPKPKPRPKPVHHAVHHPRPVPRPKPVAHPRPVPRPPPPKPEATVPPAPTVTGAARADALDTLEAAVHAAVQGATHYPPAARMMAMRGRALVGFQYRDGAISGVHLLKSSGYGLLDRAALAAVRNARYPAPPSLLSGKRLDFSIWVCFSPGGHSHSCGVASASD
ncbi:MAG: energy transducer TonB [Gammaproteobacteria bacterium]